MAELTPQGIRNIAVIGHSSAGKTSLSDALLYEADAVTRLGKVDDGSSAFDHTPEEIKRKISISNSIAQFNYDDIKINLINCPGYMDFIGESLAALHAVDNVILVVDGHEGMQFNSIKLFNESRRHNLSRIIFINKIDKENASYDDALNKIKTVVESGLIPITIPIKEGTAVKGVINVLKNKAYYLSGNNKTEVKEIPDDLRSMAESYRTKMIESAAETKDSLMEKYLDQGSLSEKEIIEALKEGVLNGALTPVFCGVANQHIGILPLLDFFKDSMPSPAERRPVKVVGSDGTTEIECKPDLSGHLKAFVFKTVAEPHIGELNYVRVFSGALNYGEEFYNSSRDSHEKAGQMNFLTGKEKKDVKKIIAGDMGILLKLKKTFIGDSLCSVSEKIKFHPIEFPKALLDTAIAAKTKTDEDKLSGAMHKLMEEDPTIHVRVDPELKQTIISGMGQIQIDIFIANLKNKYNVNVELEKPKIPYRETIKRKSEGQGKYKKQTGGRGQYGDCWLKLEPLPLNGERDFEFVNDIVGGSIPGKYIPSVERGVKESLAKGLLANYPVIKIKVSVYDGSYHAVDSSDIAFQIAGSMALKKASESASLILLEPIQKVKIYTPDKYMGDIMSDVNSHRGKILGMDEQDGLKVVNAYIPQAELNGYINELKSITQGSGTFESRFDHYAEVPHDVSQKIVELSKKEKTEEKE